MVEVIWERTERERSTLFFEPIVSVYLRVEGV